MKNNFSIPHTCPWWLISTFDNPLRKLIHDPQQISLPMFALATVLDVGCGMGYFSLARRGW
jgi:2-polyprenyl-3-methyl-5-hydroxy-6-metoxy-1,4-benzoquinol methylase